MSVAASVNAMSITFYLQGVVKTPANIYDVDLCDNS